jgi:dihydrofolate synthase/folylpolyglutamate synthase
LTIKDLEQAEQILQKYVPNVSKYSGDNLSLDRMWPLLDKVGNPHTKLKVIHIAGTSGKTSTCYYISALLSASGCKVGLTVSPHVDSVTERIQINNSPLKESLFCKELEEFINLINDLEIQPSYFELLIVFVLWQFVRQNVDYAVVETGLGGLIDGTNVVTREDKVCVITDIGFDHMDILGDTLDKIASQKAGIIHYKNQVFVYSQQPQTTNQIKRRAKAKDAQLSTLNQDLLQKNSNYDFSRLPDFQIRNWLLAEEICNFVAKRDSFELNKIFLPSDVIVPGRMETTILHDKSILIMDGAHNRQKVGMFCESFKKIYPNKTAIIMLALKKGKEYKQVIDELEEISSEIVLTTFSASQDLPVKSQNPIMLADYCSSKSINNIIIEDHADAMKYLLNSNEDIKVVIGSFYLLGQIRKLI